MECRKAVLHFSENNDFNQVRHIQQRILAAYEQDFSKHAPNEIVSQIRMLWNSIPSQLTKENKKFLYGLVREGGRAKDYEAAIMWLSDCGLVHKISRINTPKLPLKAYEDLKAFKLFIVDVGLLGCMTGLRQQTLLETDPALVELNQKYARHGVWRLISGAALAISLVLVHQWLEGNISSPHAPRTRRKAATPKAAENADAKDASDAKNGGAA